MAAPSAGGNSGTTAFSMAEQVAEKLHFAQTAPEGAAQNE
jgi:hypothetical protein